MRERRDRVLYSQYFNTRQTPQSEPIPDKEMAQNNAGGYGFRIGPWERLDRFLILGSEGGTYYVTERALTVQNAKNLLACVRENGAEVVRRLVDVSVNGKAHKNGPALFALAACISFGDTETKRLARKAVLVVARTPTHLFEFIEYAQSMRGWGRVLRDGVAAWYLNKPLDQLAYQTIKYRQRGGWTHRDALRKAHPYAAWDKGRNALFRWITHQDVMPGLPIVQAFAQAQTTEDKAEMLRLIQEARLPWEAIPTKWLKEPSVWDALLQHMPLHATVRNLGRLSALGLLDPLSKNQSLVLNRLSREYIRKGRLHPMAILLALRVYQQGHAIRGELKWPVNARLVDGLDDAFYMAFENVTPTNKRLLLALDVSASMGMSLAGAISCREAAAAMALVTARTERDYAIVAFADEMIPLDISPRERLDDVLRKTSNLPFRGTDCALPMMYALGYGAEYTEYPGSPWMARSVTRYVRGARQPLDVDAFVIYTDNESWAGAIHPVQALDKYRRERNPQAKLCVAAMAATEFSVADPNDGGMLDVVGFSADTPKVIAQFINPDIASANAEED